MALTPGTRLGSYEITAQIGVGGMGEVYRATDTNLKRQVAIKVLPASVAGDTERLARFQREAEVLAALNHPHIAQIHGLEKTPDFTALVMELVEGDDLSQRIARGAIPIDEALPIAKQIAEALEAAHEQGIIHRDLKPANIKVRADGTVKVLDFGLAKAMEPPGAARAGGPGEMALSQSPTITTPAMTRAGMILGTAAYMSPEQARGKVVDKRADIWAFGAVLYEMLTGRRAFPGEDVTDTLALVVRGEPAWDALPTGLSPVLTTYLRRCLQKDPRQRVHDVADLRLALDGGFDLHGVESANTAPAAHRWWWGWLAAGVAGALTGAALVWLAVGAREASSTVLSTLVVQFDVAPPEGSVFPGANGTPRMELSPDGRWLAITTQGEDISIPQQLWIRPLDSSSGTLITKFTAVSGEPVQQPFWSRDSRRLGFFVDGSMRRVNLDGTAIQTLAQVPGNNYGGTWNADGTILFGSSGTEGLRRVSDGGGTPVQVSTLDASRGEVAHYWPQFLPDGRHFLYLVLGAGGDAVYAGSLDSAERTLIVETPVMARFAEPGDLFFIRDGSLMVQAFDPDRLSLSGEPAVLVDRVQVAANGRAGFSVSDTGILAFREGATATDADSQLVWVDRSGKEIGNVGPKARIRGVGLSADGLRAAFHQEDSEGAGDIWVLDVARSVASRLTFDPENHNFGPVLTPDGSTVVFARVRGGANRNSFALYARDAGGAGAERLLFDGGLRVTVPWTMSPDASPVRSSRRTATGSRMSRMKAALTPCTCRAILSPTPSIRCPRLAGAISRDGVATDVRSSTAIL